MNDLKCKCGANRSPNQILCGKCRNARKKIQTEKKKAKETMLRDWETFKDSMQSWLDSF